MAESAVFDHIYEGIKNISRAEAILIENYEFNISVQVSFRSLKRFLKVFEESRVRFCLRLISLVS